MIEVRVQKSVIKNVKIAIVRDKSLETGQETNPKTEMDIRKSIDTKRMIKPMIEAIEIEIAKMVIGIIKEAALKIKNAVEVAKKEMTEIETGINIKNLKKTRILNREDKYKGLD
jgi:hypothetical protein